jgi:hypothetical protein
MRPAALHGEASAIAVVITFAAASPSRAADPLVAFGDFDNDGLEDVAVVTSPTTITISLANPDGSYTVSAILSAPKNQQITYIGVYDRDGDGDLDVNANCPAGGTSWYIHTWSGNGDGTFGPRVTNKWSWPKGRHGFF